MYSRYFLGCLVILMSRASFPAEPPLHTTATASMGAGFGTSSHPLGSSSDTPFDVTALRLSLGFKRQNHELRLALTGLSSMGFIAVGRARTSEFALLYGYRVAQGKRGYLCPSGGIAYARVHRDVTVQRSYGSTTWSEEVDQIHNLAGLAINLRGVRLLTPGFGLGAEWFADINVKNSFTGLLFILNFGP